MTDGNLYMGHKNVHIKSCVFTTPEVHSACVNTPLSYTCVSTERHTHTHRDRQTDKHRTRERER